MTLENRCDHAALLSPAACLNLTGYQINTQCRFTFSFVLLFLGQYVTLFDISVFERIITTLVPFPSFLCVIITVLRVLGMWQHY